MVAQPTFRHGVLVLALLGFACLEPAPRAQAHPHMPEKPPVSASQTQGWPNNQPPDPNVIDAQKRAQKQLGKQRYKDIQQDSDRLLTLATQLKQQVDAAGEHTLSLDVIKKAEEIEKLAKDVRNKMKG